MSSRRDYNKGDSLPTTAPNSPPGSSSTDPEPPVESQGWLKHFESEISLDHADIPIIACCFVAGLCDSSAYNAWSCFVSMQTGNTIFLALGASGQPVSRPYGWLKSLCSIMFFIIGCLFFAQTRKFSPMRRGTLAVSFILQSLCIFVAAALVQARVVASPIGLIETAYADVDFKELIPLGLLAFQSGGQIVTSRLLGFNEVPTTVLTSVYCDLASDPALIDKNNVKRNRRAAAVVMLLVGGIAGGWLSRSNAGMSSALWIAGGIKVAIAIGWSTWKARSAIEL